MLFTSILFILVFVPITLLVYKALYSRSNQSLRLWWLVVASILFYSWWYPPNLILLVASIALNYLLGNAILKKEGNRKPLLVVGVAMNLGAIIFFKYSNFLAANLGLGFHHDIVLPLAISFYTFQQITYLTDCKNGTVKEPNFRNYMLYVCFFPQLIAGPIVHHSEVIPQLESLGSKYDWKKFYIGVALFAIGLSKKVFFADAMSEIATPVFDASTQGLSVGFDAGWSAALSYTLQLYFDFSGYSDMAIGLGWMFNIKLPDNFNSPYKSRSIVDFWRRWHITLSRFLRDYLYIPLGGNRGGAIFRYKNLFITMLLGGMWHGAGWTFIIWGGWHGLLLVVNHLFNGYVGERKLSTPLRKIMSYTGWAYTLLAIIIGWVLFRAESLESATTVFRGMLGLTGSELTFDFYDDYLIFGLLSLKWVMIGLLSFGALALPNSSQIILKMKEFSVSKKAFCTGVSFAIIAIALLFNLSRQGGSEFIYFNF